MDMENKEEIIQPLEEEDLDQAGGGILRNAPEEKDQKPQNMPPMADLRFI